MKTMNVSGIRGPFVVQQQGPDEPIFILDAQSRFVAKIDDDLPPYTRLEHAQLLAAAWDLRNAAQVAFALLGDMGCECNTEHGDHKPGCVVGIVDNALFKSGGQRP